MIETEKATDQLDLPHAFKGAGRVCTCGRLRIDQLHASAAREVAHSSKGTLPRELGS